MTNSRRRPIPGRSDSVCSRVISEESQPEQTERVGNAGAAGFSWHFGLTNERSSPRQIESDFLVHAS
jgi:hypothetical protein